MGKTRKKVKKHYNRTQRRKKIRGGTASPDACKNKDIRTLDGSGGFGSVYPHLIGPQYKVKVIKDEERNAFENEVNVGVYMNENELQDISGLVEFTYPPKNGKDNCLIFENKGIELFKIFSCVAGRLREETICEIMSNVCKQLSRMHAQGVAHFDIKPENICIPYRMGTPECPYWTGSTYCHDTSFARAANDVNAWAWENANLIDFGSSAIPAGSMSRYFPYTGGTLSSGEYQNRTGTVQEIAGTPQFTLYKFRKLKSNYLWEMRDMYAIGATAYVLYTGKYLDPLELDWKGVSHLTDTPAQTQVGELRWESCPKPFKYLVHGLLQYDLELCKEVPLSNRENIAGMAAEAFANLGSAAADTIRRDVADARYAHRHDDSPAHSPSPSPTPRRRTSVPAASPPARTDAKPVTGIGVPENPRYYLQINADYLGLSARFKFTEEATWTDFKNIRNPTWMFEGRPRTVANRLRQHIIEQERAKITDVAGRYRYPNMDSIVTSPSSPPMWSGNIYELSTWDPCPLDPLLLEDAKKNSSIWQKQKLLRASPVNSWRQAAVGAGTVLAAAALGTTMRKRRKISRRKTSKRTYRRKNRKRTRIRKH